MVEAMMYLFTMDDFFNEIQLIQVIDSIFFDQMDLRGKGFIDYEEFKKGFNITHPEIVDVSFQLLKEYLYHNNPTQFFPNSMPQNIDQDPISESNLLFKRFESFCLLH